MSIDISRESAAALRSEIERFDRLSAKKRVALARGDFDAIHDLDRRQLDLAHGFVGIVDGVLRASDV